MSMIVGWAINSAIILLAASVFFKTQTPVSELQQASQLLGRIDRVGIGLVGGVIPDDSGALLGGEKGFINGPAAIPSTTV